MSDVGGWLQTAMAKNIRSVKGETEEGTCRDGEG